MRSITLPADSPRRSFREWSRLICGQTYHPQRGMTPNENQQEQRWTS